MNKEEKIINGYYSSNIKTSRKEDSVYAMKYASQQMLIDKLQKENQELKERHYLIQGGRGNCKTLVLMLQKENDKYKTVLDEIRNVVENKIKELENSIEEFDYDKTIKTYCKGKMTTLKHLLQILDKAKESK